MGFYIRKSLSVGPLRFNLSGSGIGVSAGVRGLRFGAGPRGNYVHMGRHGLYFRQTLPTTTPRPSLPGASSVPRPLLNTTDTAIGALREIESGSVAEMTDASSAALLDELREKQRRTRIKPFVLTVGIVAALSATLMWDWWYGLAVALLTFVLGRVAHARDAMRKTTVVMYDLEAEPKAAFEQLHAAISALASCSAAWHLAARAQVRDRKYHAGAGQVVQRTAITIRMGQPPWVQTNVDVPLIPAGRQTLAFLPDRLLVFEATDVGAVPYSQLAVERREQRFIEDGTVPPDSTTVGRTWKYVNKSGGADRRFKDNRELPICAYEEVSFTSPSGLNELIQVSRRAAGDQVAEAVKAMKALGLQEGTTAAAQPPSPVDAR